MTDLTHTDAPEPDRWELHVDIEWTEDPERQFPFDDVSQFVAFLGKEWGLLPEDLTEIIKWNDTGCVRVAVEMLDHLLTPIHWLLLHTLPHQIVVKPGHSS